MRFRKPIRLDHSLYADPDQVFHLVIRTHPEVGRIDQGVSDRIWESALEQKDGGRVVLLAACLMPDHLHLLLKPGSLDVIRWLNSWKSWSTRLAWAAGHRGPLWQPSAWDRAIRNESEFAATVGYIARNPVEAGLCRVEEEWPYLWVAT